MSAQLLVKKLHPDAIVPTCAHPGKDLGFDLYALEDTGLVAGVVTRVRTGVAVAMYGHGFRIADRSSMALRGIRTSGGVIDEGYTGEMFANLTYNGTPYSTVTWVRRGERIAQFIPQRVCTDNPIAVVDELPISERGPSGYGSTGA